MSQPVSKSGNNASKRVKTGGRKRMTVDPVAVEHYASIGLKTRDISILTGMPERSLERKFGALLIKRRAQSRAELIERQWQAAKAGDRTLLIWLGKNYAEQSDRTDITASEGLKVIVERIG